ncbi:ankyrin repeat protein [Colletotrichum kahawae]|uniref:Ankyrin repeat protein n=1 Tax=Colletotrichum kahawae TaxID=34407 RepID=A0AAE0D6Y4_COLKA|nr:ankyrin repeat protein [Colletotrichum kahawae]
MSEAKPALPNLWTKAAETLRNDPEQEKRDLINRYFEIVQSDLGTADATRIDVAKHLNAKVEELNERRPKITWGSHEADVKAVFTSAAQHINAAKNLITTAASSDPHAALACAGGLMLLTLLIRPIEQREQLLGGLDLTTSIIAKHAEIDPRSWIGCLDSIGQVENDLERTLVKLYAKILELQARGILYFQRDRSSRFVRDMFRGNIWRDIISEIRILDAQSRESETLVFQERLHRAVDATEKAHQDANLKRMQERRTDLLKELFTCPYADRKDINPPRVKGTCDWFIQHNLFRQWVESSEPKLLWVSADPGCGKSVLSKFLVDEVLISNEQQITCYFFFKEDFVDQKNASAAICAILRQLFVRNSELMTETVLHRFESDGTHLLKSFRGLLEILISLVAENKMRVQCIVDALDECEETDRREFITALTELYSNDAQEHNLKFIVTSRPYIQIQRGFRKLESRWPTIHLRGEDDAQAALISDEVDIFANRRIDEISQYVGLTEDETLFLRSQVMRTKSRTYSWVKLTLDVVENMCSFTKEAIHEVLSSLPEDLDKLYEKILLRSTDFP